ncbi:MAG: lysophospholipid acyltransferase family protein [Candidatus Poribacteria bacterium]|nr:lysophospholipid acyltransferase family protein [Candidatus Poribacteria bacterium]
MTWRDLKHKLVFYSLSFLSYLLQRVSGSTARNLGNQLGTAAYHLLKRRRRITLQNMTAVFSNQYSKSEIGRLCQHNFREIGKTTIEFLRFPIFNRVNIWQQVEFHGEDHLLQALTQQKGVILFLPHFGNWEILSLAYGARFPDQVKAVAFRLKNRQLNDLVWTYREHLSVEIIPQRQAIRKTLRALKNNGIVGFLADQNATNAGVFVNFFSRPVYAVRGPVALALRTGAPILFSIAIRQPNGRHLIEIREPTCLRITDDYDSDVRYNTQKMLEILETYICRYPEQWLWMHDRWKFRPTHC